MPSQPLPPPKLKWTNVRPMAGEPPIWESDAGTIVGATGTSRMPRTTGLQKRYRFNNVTYKTLREAQHAAETAYFAKAPQP